MELLDVVEPLEEFKLQLDKVWNTLKLKPNLVHLHDLNFIAQVFAAKVVYITEGEMVNENKKASKTP